jgi:hypothetical protein
VTEKEAENASSIRVEINQYRREGGKDHRGQESSEIALPEATVVPKGSQPAMLGLSTG